MKYVQDFIFFVTDVFSYVLGCPHLLDEVNLLSVNTQFTTTQLMTLLF